jgi:hypothetical protein
MMKYIRSHCDINNDKTNNETNEIKSDAALLLHSQTLVETFASRVVSPTGIIRAAGGGDAVTLL